MLEELKQWLIRFVPIELADLYLSAFEAFADLEENGAEIEFELRWKERDMTFSGDLLDDLRGILQAGTQKILREHGILFNSTTTLDLEVKAVESLIWLNLTDEDDKVMEIFSLDVSPEDRVAELFQYVNGDSLTRWTDVIESVNEMFIEKVLADHGDVKLIEDESVDYDLEGLTRYESKFINRLYRKALEVGINPGAMTAEQLVQMFDEDLNRFCPFSPREAAIDLAGLVLFAKGEKKNLSMQAGLVAEKVYGDIDFLRALKAQLQQVFGEIRYYG